MFSELVGGHHDSFRGCEGAQAGDQKFPGNDQGHGPNGNYLVSDKANEGGGGENLVGQRIHEFAEIGDELVTPGNLAIEPIGECGEQEQPECRAEAVGKIHRETENEKRREPEPRQRQAVWKIHAKVANGVQTGITTIINPPRRLIAGRRGHAPRRCIFPRSGGVKPIPRASTRERPLPAIRSPASAAGFSLVGLREPWPR